jgi:hypothetical protein
MYTVSCQKNVEPYEGQDIALNKANNRVRNLINSMFDSGQVVVMILAEEFIYPASAPR